MEQRGPRGQGYIKKYNTQLVLSIIRAGPVSRADLAKKTGMSPATITRLVGDLISAGLVLETDKYSGGLGRRATLLALAEDATYTLGIHVDADYVEICLVDYARRVLGSVCPEGIAPSGEEDGWMRQVLQSSRALAEDLGIPWDKVQGAGVGISGIVDKDSGRVMYAPSMKMSDYPLGQKLQALFEMPVVLEHDVKAGLLGEVALSPDLAQKHVVLFWVGAGVGSATMTNGSFVRGNGNVAGEIGHTVMDPHGEECKCGRHGCLQTFISERYVTTRAARHQPGIRNIGQFIHHYRLGSDWAVKIYDELVMYLSVATENLACIYNPQTLILGGHLFTTYPEFFPLVRDSFARHAYLPVREDLDIVLGEPSGVSCMLGAAVTGLHRFERDVVATMAPAAPALP